MRTVQEILDAMSPELRANATKAVEDARMFAVALSKVPSPSALNGMIEHPLDNTHYDDVFA